MTLFDGFKSQIPTFKGDLRLFWAGKMSEASKMICRCTAKNLSGRIELLELCRNEYDLLIFGGYEYEKD
jgi:hypothetical protein